MAVTIKLKNGEGKYIVLAVQRGVLFLEGD